MGRFDWLWNLWGGEPKEAPAAAPAPQPPAPKVPMASDLNWKMLIQINMYLVVGKAIEFILANPRPIQQLDLSEWKIIEGPPHKVQHKLGMFRPFDFDNLPVKTSDFPVLVGQANGKKFVFDGAHRTAHGVMLKRASIPAVVFTEEETRSFIRPGFKADFDKAVGL